MDLEIAYDRLISSGDDCEHIFDELDLKSQIPNRTGTIITLETLINGI